MADDLQIGEVVSLAIRAVPAVGMNARIVAGSIARRLAKLSPDSAKAFEKNLIAFQKALDERMFGAALVKKIGGGKLWAMELKGALDKHLAEQKLSL